MTTPTNHQIREVLETVVCHLMTEDGDQVLVCSEPDGPEPGKYDSGNGWTFDLTEPFSDEFWGELCEISESAWPATGADLIATERDRQITAEGWTADHDAEHDCFELSAAARAYTRAAEATTFGPNCATFDGYRPGETTPSWPWASEWWKPSDDPIRNLVKAGALIAAEIDRLLLAATK